MSEREVQVFEFEGTGDAYNETQRREDIKRGDVLLIKSEKVVGLADTWPVITKEAGELHPPTPEVFFTVIADMPIQQDSLK